jgi:hypothetical protein
MKKLFLIIMLLFAGSAIASEECIIKQAEQIGTVEETVIVDGSDFTIQIPVHNITCLTRGDIERKYIIKFNIPLGFNDLIEIDNDKIMRWLKTGSY